MSHADKTRDVFISHSSKDKAIADAICAILESNQIRCWVAPRDIHPGTSWSEAIIEGLDQCKLVVVVFNSNSNQSDFVAREVERAASKGIPIIPFRTEEVLPSKGIELFVSGAHWLDAMTPPIEAHIGKLVDVVSRFLNVDAEPSGAAMNGNAQEPTIDEDLQPIDQAGFSSSQLLENPRSLVGQEIAGRYKLKQFLAQGGGGAVFEAFDENLFRKVCLKIAYPLKQCVERLRGLVEKGVRGVVQMRHSGIVPILDFDEYSTVDGKASFFITLELVDGQSLGIWADQLDDSEESFKRKLAVAVKLASVIDDAHQFRYIGEDGIEVVGVLHGDIKPNNVIVDNDDEPKLIDFMLVDIQQLQSEEVIQAIEHDAPLTAAFGTPDFMSPEQVDRGIITSKTDVYSFGCTLLALFGPTLNDLARDSSDMAKIYLSCVESDPCHRATMRKINVLLRKLRNTTNQGKFESSSEPPAEKRYR